ncbi:hypothetical protein HNR46_003743 [Haloferula luteola]|uniref:CotH protein n=1 Tax=Haloferula luteola TaxID=595692 RepID=A0A840V688_9BACT|nr:lamin tail domain-containing protein [Haloferula luteola]MBB5353482.1 hypothetical protein [Haloferula luteola]
MMPSCTPLILLAFAGTGSLLAAPMISEIMADNEATLADEDGDFSDWVEIHNPDAEPISLANWSLTDSAGNLTKWRFPDVTLDPGGFLLVWASGKNRRLPDQPLHTNFALSAGGEYLALVGPDAVPVDDFDPEFPAMNDDEAYGRVFDTQVLLGAGATIRYRIPQDDSDSDWYHPDYDDQAWASGPSGLGDGLEVPGITARQVFKNGSVGGLADALALLTLPAGDPGILAEATHVVDMANFLGSGSDGHYDANQSPPGGNGENYVIQLTGSIEVPTAGTYTFGLNSDDGGQLSIDGSVVIADDSFHAPQDHLGSRYLRAGSHTFVVVMFQGVGGDALEFFAAPGGHSAWNENFRLVGDASGGGLAAFTPSAGAGEIVATHLSPALDGQAGGYFRVAIDGASAAGATSWSLISRHKDGLVAWFDGQPVVSHQAPLSPLWNSTATAARLPSEALRPLGFPLPPPAPGSHLLALQGMKHDPADAAFLMLPEVVAGSVDSSSPPAFFGAGKATPGWINLEPTSFGKIADTTFSVDRGYFTDPVEVAIETATAGATIRYTTDGSTPSATHGEIYTMPLVVSSTTVLRAIATRPGWEPTDVDTQTYLFLDSVVQQSASGAAPAGWPSSSGTDQVLDYGMDPQIVGHGNPEIGGVDVIKAALADLPAVSLVTDLPHLFNIDGSQGIYSNPGGRGFAWERPVSVEWIHPPDALHPHGSGEFQIPAGLRIRGGFSRSTQNPKHSFRLYFRNDYGAGKLKYPLFGHRGPEEFDQIDLRTAQNYSWSFEGSDENTFLREESSRQAFLEMGRPGSHVRYCHLYLNGQYWGLYNLDERTEASFAESYLGGDKDDYDVVKSEADAGYVVGATDGNLDAWREMWNLGKTHRSSPTDSNYFRLMGLAADGVTPTGDPVLLDPGNLVDYLLLTFWTGNLDGCTSAFLGNDRANNWFGTRRREGNEGEGFQFFVHDFEHTFFNVNEDRTGPFVSSREADFAYSNPLFLHQDLRANAEYRLLWADRIQKHLVHGALEPAAWQQRVSDLAGILDRAIAAESARWGDAKSSTPKTRQTWLGARDRLLAYFSPRGPVVLSQLRADGLYPALDAPAPFPLGGYQDSGVEVAVATPEPATTYYMPDGSDPRAVGGGLRAGALVHSATDASEIVIPWSDDGWRYLYDGSDAGTAWRERIFNDRFWPLGTAELGYGDGDEATVIPIHEVAPGQKAATAYFRKHFTLDSLSGLAAAEISILYDDACAVYLNGVRIAGDLPLDPAYDAYSGNAVEELTSTVTVDPTWLMEGDNVIAVEVHQAGPTSSDLSLDLTFRVTRSVATTPLILTGAGERPLRLRCRAGSTWSALSEATFLLDTEPASPANLAISEIHYHPADPSPAEISAGFDDAEDFEFVELLNTGTRHVDLQGVYFDGAIRFDFTNAATGRTLAPGARCLVVSDEGAFLARYGTGKSVAGEYSGQLANSGETLVLYTPGEAPLRRVDYLDSLPWPTAADGSGYSLVRRHPAESFGDSEPEGWRLSGSLGGSPGELDAPSPGSFDAWAESQFVASGLAASGVSGILADPDGDGRPNFDEYALATDPLIPDLPEVRFVWSGGTHAALQIRRPENPQNLLYELLAADHLSGPWAVVAEQPVTTEALDDGQQRAVFRDSGPTGVPQRFLRIRTKWSP